MNLSVELYKKLYLIRTVEEAIIKYYPEDDMKTPMHMSMGEEAVVVGVCHALSDKDQVLGSYRSHALYLAKVQESDNFFAELYGKETGIAGGRSGSMHLCDPGKGSLCCSAIVGSTISMAVGVALANQMKKNNQITAVFFGDGGTDAGVFWESLNYSCLEKLPIIFVHEDNNLAVHTTLQMRKGFDSLNQIISQFRCDTYETNTTDVETLYELTCEVIQKLRRDQKPAFMNLKYYRYLEHVGISKDFDAGYRSEKEFEDWFKRDPVQMQRKRILESQRRSEDELSQIENEILTQVEQSVKRAKNASFSSTDTLYQDVFK